MIWRCPGGGRRAGGWRAEGAFGPRRERNMEMEGGGLMAWGMYIVV